MRDLFLKKIASGTRVLFLGNKRVRPLIGIVYESVDGGLKLYSKGRFTGIYWNRTPTPCWDCITLRSKLLPKVSK